MAFVAGSAELLREALAARAVEEKRMFDGITLMLNGHLCFGVHKDGAMFRIGVRADALALDLPGVRPMGFTGKPMPGYVECSDAVPGADATRLTLIGLAPRFNKTLGSK